jgi:hypothetical protein
MRRPYPLLGIVALVAAVTMFIACKENKVVVTAGPERLVADHTDSVTFTDITKKAGIVWKHMNGADGRKYFPEENGSGSAIFDYDNDGWQDILITQCRHWPDKRTAGPESTMVLYHNNHDGTFSEVTEKAGLAIPMFSMGCSVGDFDNDGWMDLYITNLGGNYLFHNENGVFKNVTEKSKTKGYGNWSSSSMWVDYDNDGFLDLLCVNYAFWSPQTDIFCTIDGMTKSYCTPQLYPGDYMQMFHNNHDGTFADVTQKVGMKDQKGKGLGCIMFDYDEDGWTDIMISDDLSPNRLYHNEQGTFKEIGVEAGIAYDESGQARAGMGMDYGDVDRDGKFTVMIANFSGEMDWVYKYMGNDVFVDRAPTNGIGTISLPFLTFGLMMWDYDYDGWIDMFCVNGHVQPEIEAIQRTTAYRMPSLLFRNLGNGKFEEVGFQYMKGPFDKKIIGRGASYGDINNDGNVDILAVSTNDYPVLFQCERTNTNHYLRIKLEGTKSNRNGFGARIYATVGKMKMVDMMKSGSSFQGSNEPITTLGIGQAKQIDELTIKWNCGTVDVLKNVPCDQTIVIKEGTGGFAKLY